MRQRLRPRPARPRRRWRTALAILAAALALWIFWPAPTPQSEAPVDAKAKPAVQKAQDKPPEKAPPTRLATPAAPPRPKAPEQSPVLRARRDLLLAAVRARAASLRPCVPDDAAELRVPVRLHVLRKGPVKSLEFPGEPPPRELRDCLRRIAGGWNFQDVELPGDVELFATLALSPGA